MAKKKTTKHGTPRVRPRVPVRERPKRNGHAKRQTQIPGTEPPDEIEAVDNAIADFLNARTTLLDIRKETLKLKIGVLALLREHDRKVYIFRDGVYRYIVRANDEVTLHVKRDHEKSAEETRPKRAREGQDA